jgi:CheY-like chemotaxis protein
MGEPMRPSVAVLIVEDEPLIRMGTVYLIEDAGFDVYEAGSADAAIALLQLHKEIRLILTDVDRARWMGLSSPTMFADDGHR